MAASCLIAFSLSLPHPALPSLGTCCVSGRHNTETRAEYQMSARANHCTAQSVVNRQANFEACNLNVSSLSECIYCTAVPVNIVWTNQLLRQLGGNWTCKGKRTMRGGKQTQCLKISKIPKALSTIHIYSSQPFHSRIPSCNCVVCNQLYQRAFCWAAQPKSKLRTTLSFWDYREPPDWMWPHVVFWRDRR